MKRTDQLTFTRFLAAITVVVFHYGDKAYPFTIPPLDQLVPTGHIFVSYFFALSGFIMAMVYFRPANNIQPIKYWIYRFARIYPVYLLGLLLTMFFNPKMWQDILAVRLNLTLLQSWWPPYPMTLNYPGWSLSVEAFFYILFPILLWLSYRMSLKLNAWLVGLFWLGSLLGHTYLMNTVYVSGNAFYHDLLFYNPLVHLNTFLVGCLGGRWWVETGHKHIPNAWQNRAILLFSTILIGLALLYLKDLPKTLGFPIRITLPNGVLAPLFLVFIVSLAYENGLISKIFRLPFFVLLGDASYSVYILQYPAHIFYKKYLLPLIPNPTDTSGFYLYFLALILFSILIFKLIESPIRDLAKQLYQRSPMAKRGW